MPTDFPLRDILKDIANGRKISLVELSEGEYSPSEIKEKYPNLNDLPFNFVEKVVIKDDNVTVFEGSNEDVSIAYFGRKVEEYSMITRECGLVYDKERKIQLILNEDGHGDINVIDTKVHKARWELGDDNFGSPHKPHVGKYGFIQRDEGYKLPGVKRFLESILN